MSRSQESLGQVREGMEKSTSAFARFCGLLGFSHNHGGSGQWLYLKGNYYSEMHPFLTEP